MAGFWTGFTDRLFGLLGYVRATARDAAVSPPTRHAIYRVNELLYDNKVYAPRAYGGALEDVLAWYFGQHAGSNVRVVGHFLPCKEIVDLYAGNVLPGVWGGPDGVKVDKDVDGRPVNPALLPPPYAAEQGADAPDDPLTRIWRDSNLDTAKGTLCRWAANLGTVGLRPVYDPDADRVTVQADHPGRIFDVEEDSDGNVTAVCLKYHVPLNRGTAVLPVYEQVEVVETLDKEGFSRTLNGQEQIPDDRRKNRWGFCPYVILRHRDNGTLFGDWAYKGSEDQIHAVNYGISQQSASILRHLLPHWFGSAAGQPPTTMDLGGSKMSFVQRGPTDPEPFLQAIVPNVNHADAQGFWMALRDLLRGRQPELNFNDVRLIAGTSGETIAQVLKPTEGAVKSVRPAYSHAMIRVLQMGVSIGSEQRLWDVGAGTGPESGDRAYVKGLLRFRFAEMPALPQTAASRLNDANAKVAEENAKTARSSALADAVSNNERLRLAGYTDEEIAKINEERATQDAVPTGPGAADGSQGAGGGQGGPADLSSMSDADLIAHAESLLAGAA